MSTTVNNKIPRPESLVIAFDASNPASVPNMNDTTPATIYDCSGNGNHANVRSGELSYTVRDGVRCWDNSGGTTPDGYTITSNANLTTAQFCMAFWMNPDAQDAGWERFLAQGSNTFELAMANDDTDFGQVRIYDGGWRSTAVILYVGEWNFLVLNWYNGAGNKLEVISNSAGYNTYSNSNARTRSGNIYFCGDDGTEHYDGGISQFYMWNTILTEAEITDLFLTTNIRYKLTAGWGT